MNFRKGDIVLIDFPFSNLKESKKRPAIVISNIKGENLILCQITTVKRSTQVTLKKEDTYNGLRVDSFISYDTIFTIHSSKVIFRIGEVKEEILIELQNKLIGIIKN